MPTKRDARTASSAKKGKIGPGATDPVVLRHPLPTDQAQAETAQAELAADDFNFLLRGTDQTWAQWLTKVERDMAGTDLAPGRVPATMLFAMVGDNIVGRVHLRHELTDALLQEGGHLGYAVRPAFRRRGYATQLLRQGLEFARDLGIEAALVTCDDDNPGSIGTIERCGGVLEDKRPRADGTLTRRYWIDLA